MATQPFISISDYRTGLGLTQDELALIARRIGVPTYRDAGHIFVRTPEQAERIHTALQSHLENRLGLGGIDILGGQISRRRSRRANSTRITVRQQAQRRANIASLDELARGRSVPTDETTIAALEGLAGPRPDGPYQQRPFTAAEASSRTGSRVPSRTVSGLSAREAAERAAGGRMATMSNRQLKEYDQVFSGVRRAGGVGRAADAAVGAGEAGAAAKGLFGLPKALTPSALGLAAMIFGPQLLEIGAEALGIGPQARLLEFQKQAMAEDRKSKASMLKFGLAREESDRSYEREQSAQKRNLMATLMAMQSGYADQRHMENLALGGLPNTPPVAGATFTPAAMINTMMSDSDIPAEAMGLI